jgi:AcrR family transcriptional regulator
MNKVMEQSKLNAGRQDRKHQVDQQRASILDAAETLFLCQGIDTVTMVDIATQAGITKVTLYRYFPNRDALALEIRSRMFQRIAALGEPIELPLSLEGARALAQAMIRNFDALRDAFRFLGMFDARYLDHPPEAGAAQWAKQAIAALSELDPATIADPEVQRAVVILSAVLWFLEKVAVRGEVIIGAPELSLTQQLQMLEEMVMVYIAHLLAAR